MKRGVATCYHAESTSVRRSAIKVFADRAKLSLQRAATVETRLNSYPVVARSGRNGAREGIS